jgi:N-acetylmuramoyl-L-alanine amidase
VVIDPGHGGVDPGTVGVGGVAEKTIVLETALAVRDAVERTGRYRVVLTREDDTFLRLRERVALAREVAGDVFVSLHADSWSAPGQRGASVYTLSSTASDEEAGRLASKENKSDILAGTDLSHHDPVVASILIDLAQRDTSNRSIELADLIAEELAEATPAVHRGRRFAGFAVLKSPDVPSVLLELGYLSNPEDARNLSQPAYRAGLAAAVLRALDRHFARARS